MTIQISDIEAQLETLRQEAQSAITTAGTLERLEELRVGYLGKKRPTVSSIRQHGQIKSSRPASHWGNGQ